MMKKAGSIFLFLVFGCAVVFGQVQPDPRVLVKQAGATTGQVLKWDGLSWSPGSVVNRDSAWSKGLNYSSPVYTGKSLNDYIFRKGKVSIRTADTTGMLNILENDTLGAANIVLHGNGEYLLKVKKDTRSGTGTDLNFTRKYGSSGDGSFNNQIFALGWNVAPGGGMENSSYPSASYRIEENFKNGTLPNAFECHLPHIQFTDNVGRRPLSGYFGRTPANRWGHWAYESDFIVFKDFHNASYKGALSFNSNSGYLNGLTFVDTSYIRMGVIGGIQQRNSANSAYIALIKVDATDQVLLGGQSETRVAAYNHLRITNGGILSNENGAIQVGTSGARTALFIDAPNAIVSRWGVTGTNYIDQRIDGQDWNVQSLSTGNSPFYLNYTAPAFSFSLKSTGRLGLGTYSPSARLHLVTTEGSTVPVVRMENSTGTNDFYRTNTQPEGALTGNTGDLTTGTVSSIGQAFLKRETSGSNAGWEPVSTGMEFKTQKGFFKEVALPTTVNNTVYLGVIGFGGGGGVGHATITVSAEDGGTGVAVTKQYILPNIYNSTSSVWNTLLPTSSSGIRFGEDFALEVRSNASNDSLRVRRTAGTTASALRASINLENTSGSTTTWTPLTFTWNGPAVPSTIFPYNAYCVEKDKMGLGTAGPTDKLHVVGDVRITGAFKDSNNDAGTTGQVLSTTATGTDWVTPGSSDGNGIYGGSGTIPNNTNATATDDFTITTADATGTQAPKFRVVATGTDPGVQVWKVGNDSLQLSFIGGEPTFEAIGASGDFWINSIGNDVRIGNGSTGVFTHTTKNVLGGYLAVPYVQTAASITVNEATSEVDVVGTSGTITLTFDNTSNLLGSAAKTITVRNRGAFNVTLSRGSQSWQWSDMTGTNTASNQTLSPGETAKMLWVDAGATDYYVLHKIPATFSAGSTNLAISGTSSPLTLTSDTGTDVTLTAGTNVTLSGTTGNVTINATTQQAYATVQEEGSSLTQRTLINFVGSTATAADNTTKTDVTFDSDVNALASTATTGLYAVTGTGTSSTRTITAPAAGITVSNGNGVSGNPTLALANDLSAVEGLSTNGITARTATDTWTTRTITAPAAGITVSNGDGVSGNPTLALANDLSAVEGLSANGVAVRTATDTWTTRTLTAGAGISITNGDGVSGNPTISSTAGGETIISPASFSTDQNDWNPTSLSTATGIRLTTSVNLLMITGITAPSADKMLSLTNIGSNTVLLTTNDPSSSAANRFTFGRDVPIYPGKTVRITYDLTSALWRLVDKTDQGGNLRQSTYKYTLGGATTAPEFMTFSGSGGVTQSAPTATKPAGILASYSSTTFSVGTVAIGSTSNYVAYSSSSTRTSILYETNIVTPASLSDGTNTYYLRCGVNVNPAVEPQGIFFLYNHSNNSGKWLCEVKGSSASSLDSGVTFAVSTAYKLTIQARPDNSVAFFINESYVGEITTNYPTQPLLADVYLINYAGSSTRAVEVQSMELTQVR